jgi:hypothetical protein
VRYAQSEACDRRRVDRFFPRGELTYKLQERLRLLSLTQLEDLALGAARFFSQGRFIGLVATNFRWYALLIKDVAETVQRSRYIVFLYYCSSGLHARKAIA